MRIVSLVPSITELLVDLGLEDALAGVTKFCVHPSQLLKTKMIVGGTKKLDHERIARINPTLIIANREENSRTDIEALQQKYPVYLSDIHDLEEALTMIVTIGNLTGTKDRAEAMVQQIRESFDALEKCRATASPKKIAYFIWREPYMVVAGNTFIHDMLNRAGFLNIFAQQSRYPEVELEKCAELGCEEIFLSTEPFPFGEKHKTEFHRVMPDIPIRIVDGELFSWYGSRLLQAPAYFQNLLETGNGRH